MWITKAAEQGFALAQYSLGYCYANGRGVVKDLKKAVVWHNKAAEQGNKGSQVYLEDVVAQFNLGFCYHFGRGVEIDIDKAIKWYTKASQQGHTEAEYNLKYDLKVASNKTL